MEVGTQGAEFRPDSGIWGYSKVITVIPKDDGLMDLWIAGLLGLSSGKTTDAGFKKKSE
jgi:hypothetical protein